MKTYEEKLEEAKKKYGRKFPVNIPHSRLKPKSHLLQEIEKAVQQEKLNPRAVESAG
jgi:hypothetical protein